MDASLEQSSNLGRGLPGFHNIPNVVLSPMIKHSGLVFAVVSLYNDQASDAF